MKKWAQTEFGMVGLSQKQMGSFFSYSPGVSKAAVDYPQSFLESLCTYRWQENVKRWEELVLTLIGASGAFSFLVSEAPRVLQQCAKTDRTNKKQCVNWLVLLTPLAGKL